MMKTKKFEWDAEKSSADWLLYGAPAAEVLKLPDDEHLKQLQSSHTDAVVSDSSKPGRKRKSTKAAVEPTDTESSKEPAQADVAATQPVTIESAQSHMEPVADESAMDVDVASSEPVSSGSAMDVDGTSSEPAPTKKMSIYEKKGRMLSKALTFMYQQNVKLDSLGGKQVALIPLFAAEASYITIDSHGLYDIICSVGVSLGLTCQAMKTTLHPPYDDDDDDNYSITDTVLVKGVRVGRMFDKPAPTDYDRKFIGTDPGAGKLFSLPMLDDPHWKRSYSARTYYSDIGNGTRKATSESDIDSIKGLRSWMSEIPGSRTSTAKKALERLKYLYGSKFYCDLLEIRMSFATRKRR
ncbi:hypothetical protein GGI17_005314 [Coemansia sp. S146]|nr:hypothetical protein GGI17_005314 [Coemansia sp. S146]